jgi:cell division protein FtsB
MGQRVAIGVLAVLLLILQWRLWIADGGISHTHRLKSETEVQQAGNARLSARNAALDAEVRDLNSGVAAIEARARTTLGMVKEGETFYLVVQP